MPEPELIDGVVHCILTHPITKKQRKVNIRFSEYRIEIGVEGYFADAGTSYFADRILCVELSPFWGSPLYAYQLEKTDD